MSKHSNGLQQQADHNNTELFKPTHQNIQDVAYITVYDNTSQSP